MDRHSPVLARIGISIADAYRRADQREKARVARASAIDYLLAMPEELIASSIPILQALLTNQVLHADNDESVLQALSILDRAIESLPSYPAEQATLETARILSLASIGRGDRARRLLEPRLAGARGALKDQPENAATRVALTRLLVVQAFVDRHLDQSPLTPLTEAANSLTHVFVVRHAESLECVRQYLLTQHTLLVFDRSRSPQAALQRVKEVLKTIATLKKTNRQPAITTVIESEQQKLQMLLTGINHDLGIR